MPNSKVTALPAMGEMVRRLEEVLDDTKVAQQLATLIIKHTATDSGMLNGYDVTAGLNRAIYDFPSPPIAAVLTVYVEKIIIALVDDETVRYDALRRLSQMAESRR